MPKSLFPTNHNSLFPYFSPSLSLPLTHYSENKNKMDPRTTAEQSTGEEILVVEVEFGARKAPEVGSYSPFEYAKCFVTHSKYAHPFFNPSGIPNTDAEREEFNLGDGGKELNNQDFKVFCTTTVGKKLCRITVMAASLEDVERAEQVLKQSFNRKYGGSDTYWMKTMHPHHCLYCFRRDHYTDDCRHCYFCSLPGHKVLNCEEWKEDRKRNFAPYGRGGYIFYGLPPE